MNNVELNKEKVKSFILDTTFADKSKIKDETLIFKDGFLDSMGFVSIITFLETEFKIVTHDRDLIEENFESINAIVNYIAIKETT
jgi:acyl carrier protein